MRKTPPLFFVREDPRFIATNRLILIIGSSRYELDISIQCTELKPSPAEVIPIDEHFKERTAKNPFGH